MATAPTAARSVACAKALESSMSSADMCYLHEQDAASARAYTSANWLGFRVEDPGDGQLRPDLFHKLEAIAERIENVHAAEIVEGDVGFYGNAGALAGCEN